MKITEVQGGRCPSGACRSVMIREDFVPDEVIRQEESRPAAFRRAAADGEGGEVFLRQEGWELIPKDIFGVRTGEGARIVTRKTVDGERAFVEGSREVCVGHAYEGRLTFIIQPDERILGLGQHEDGVANYRGCRQYLYQNNMQIPMPVLLSTKGYGVLLGADCLMIYEEKENRITVSFDAVERISYYVIEGDTLPEVVKGFRRITGKAPLLPLWAYGYIQSRERYCSQEELTETAEEFVKRDIPVSCIVQDWQTWEEGKWGDKHLDRSRYPDLKQAAGRLHENGIGLMLSIWPNMNQGGADNREMLEAGKLLADLSTYDAFDEGARALYWKQCERELAPGGVDAWWCDSTEPFTPDWNGTVKKGEEERYLLAKESLAGFLDARRANTYAVYHAKGIHDHQGAWEDSRRVAILTRSGYPSIQRYGTILWSGDIAATWEVFRKQIVEGLQMSASGIPYWTLDIGAFFTKRQKPRHTPDGKEGCLRPWFWCGDYEDGVADKGYCELYVRWLQYGTFLPVMRSHGTDTPREPWQFGEAGTVYYDTIVKYIRLRYHLVPYIYSLAYQVYREDAMLMRALVFDYPEDGAAAEITDQFLFGDFLVCPVTEPVEYGPDSTPVYGIPKRKVYLPAGELWYDYETGLCYQGGQELLADAPVEKMPLYVRGGSILPVNTERKQDLYRRQQSDRIAVEIYGGRDGQFTCYFDSGNGYAYQNGGYAAVLLTWKDRERELSFGDKEGDYPCPEQWEISLLTAEGDRICRRAEYHGGEMRISF